MIQRFQGKVTRIVLLSEFSGQALPVATFDAAYVVTINVLKTDCPGPVKLGDQHFIIHSPTKTLRTGGEKAVGQNFKLVLSYEALGDKLRLLFLEATGVTDRESPQDR
jgi:hypothetical protein